MPRARLRFRLFLPVLAAWLALYCPCYRAGSATRERDCLLTEKAYIQLVGKPTTAINGAWNRRYGPGGSTRRLHQFSRPQAAGRYGGELGSTCVVKVLLSPGMIPPLSGQNLSANDNIAPEALAA